MTLVVDASVLVAASVDAGQPGAWAIEVITQQPLYAPHLVLVEATNVLRRLVQAGRLEQLEATEAARDLNRFGLRLLPFTPFAERVWQLRANLSSYDAWYVAIAERLDLRLATLDGRLMRAPGPTCQFLVMEK
ncbi:MAG: PIN domain-containing protein [Gammaproteobacteria bacterium]|nr:MAG: PIN domain-containing protein [Gammaproteobacteria bacterium]